MADITTALWCIVTWEKNGYNYECWRSQKRWQNCAKDEYGYKVSDYKKSDEWRSVEEDINVVPTVIGQEPRSHESAALNR